MIVEQSRIVEMLERVWLVEGETGAIKLVLELYAFLQLLVIIRDEKKVCGGVFNAMVLIYSIGKKNQKNLNCKAFYCTKNSPKS